MSLWTAGLLFAVVATDPPTPSSSSAPAKPMVIEEIEETTVGDLDGHRVPMGNVTRGTYRMPDGSERTGDICALVLPGQAPGVFVGAGSVVTVGDTRWEVLRVDNPRSGPGSVTLKQLP